TVLSEYCVSGAWQGDLTSTVTLGDGMPATLNHGTCVFGGGICYAFGHQSLSYQKFSATISGNNVTSLHFSLKPQFGGWLEKAGNGANAPIFRVLVDGEEKHEWDETNPAGCTTPFSKTYQIEIR